MKLDILLLKNLALLRKTFKGPAKKIPLEGINPKKLIITSIAGIGDAIFCLPVLKAIKTNFPKIQITFVTRENYIELFNEIFEKEKLSVRLIPYRRQFLKLLFLIYQFRKDQYEAAFFFLEDQLRLRLISFLAGIPYIFSIDRPKEKWLVSSFSNFDRPDAVYQRLKLVEEAFKRKLPRPKIYFEPDPFKTSVIVTKLKQELSVKYLIGLVPGAARAYKRWPLKNFEELGRRILHKWPEVGLVIFGNKKEQRLGETLAKNLGKKVINLCGRVPLKELPVYFKGLSLLITNDTGPLHLAVLVKTPTLSLFVPTNSEGTGPMQDPELHRVIQKERPCGSKCSTKHCSRPITCMELISVEEVWQEVEKICVFYFTT